MSSFFNPKQRSVELRSQASAVASAGLVTDDPVLKEAYVTLLAQAERLEQQGKNRPLVVELPVSASDWELQQARKRQSAQRGEDVYLPLAGENCFILPNVLLRSSLFSAGRLPRNPISNGDSTGCLFEVPVYSQRTVLISYVGEALSLFDRKIFAACLALYRSRPLEAADSGCSVSISYYLFAMGAIGSYNPKLHQSIKESLSRLGKSKLRVQWEGSRGWHCEVSLPAMVNVEFGDGQENETVRDKTSKRPKYKLEELLAECDPSAPLPTIPGWDDMIPVGKEIIG